MGADGNSVRDSLEDRNRLAVLGLGRRGCYSSPEYKREHVLTDIIGRIGWAKSHNPYILSHSRYLL